jgi:TATA-box binding protein (TBP) (component of TFIID and TFIIIB)
MNQLSDPTMNLNYNLCNIVYTTIFAETINLQTLDFFLDNTKICGKNSSIHIKVDQFSYLLQKSGSVLIFKCKSNQEASESLMVLNRKLDQFELCLTPLHPPVVCNIVGKLDLGYHIDLACLSHLIDCEYEPDLHVSLFAKLKYTKATITHKGKCMLFGAKSEKQFVSDAIVLVDIGFKYPEIRK